MPNADSKDYSCIAVVVVLKGLKTPSHQYTSINAALRVFLEKSSSSSSSGTNLKKGVVVIS